MRGLVEAPAPAAKFANIRNLYAGSAFLLSKSNDRFAYIGSMNRNDIDRHHGAPSGVRDRIVDWLGAQGPLLLTIHMCSVVALVAFAVDMTR